MSDSAEDSEKGVLIVAKACRFPSLLLNLHPLTPHPPQDAILTPLNALISAPAQRAYVSSILLLTTSLVLAGIAITAYTLFYYAYVPQIGFERTVHLQFGDAAHPYGTASLAAQLASAQKYDISVLLHLPRSPGNAALGNFMVDLQLLAPLPTTGVSGMLSASTSDEKEKEPLAQSRRPAILTYYSPVVEHILKTTELPWYVLGLRHEDETLRVSMLEGVEFSKGWRNVPASLRLEVKTQEEGTQMQIYGCKVVFRARFQGLRWLMYNHRITSFVLFTTTFWAVSMTSTFLAWAVISLFILPAFSSSSSSTSSTSTSTSAPPARNAMKSESVKSESEEEAEGFDADNLSDTSRTFPTYSRQPPLHYSAPRPRTKKEEEDAEADQYDESGRYRYVEQVGEAGEEGGYGELDDALAPLQMLPPQPWTTGEADDEDEKDEEADAFVGDSGLGTSMESSVDGSARRRRGGRAGRKRSEG